MQQISFKSLILCYILMAYVGLSFYPKWEKQGTEATISWDVSGYYLYLPAIFIYDDLKELKFMDGILKTYGPTPEVQQYFKHEKSGSHVMKYSIGQAVVMSPFFMVGHSIASLSDKYNADGFSYPYQICLGLGMLLYAFLGLYVLRLILLKYFNENTVAIVLLAFVFGTNYLNYSAIDQCLTHSPLFTIYTLIIWSTIQFYHKPTLKLSLWIGFLCGIAGLIRPTDAISVLIPLGWNVVSFKTFQDRIQYIFNHLKLYLPAVIVFGIVGLIQPLYWKIITNEWLVYSYQEQGFSWKHPHFYDYTFSFYSGWLTYCPMLLLPIIGFVFLIQQKLNHVLLTCFALLAYYIVAAWDVWDYGGISGRAMVQYYPIFAFGLAAFVQAVNKSRFMPWLFYPIFLCCIYFNLWWTYNAHRGSVPVTGLSKPLYYKVVGKWSIKEDYLKLYDNKFLFEGEMKNKSQLFFNDFEGDTSVIVANEGINGKGIFLGANLNYSPENIIKNEGQFKKWIRISTDVKSFQKEWNTWAQQQLVYKFYRGDEIILFGGLKFHRFLVDNQTRNLFLDVKIPTANWDRVGIFYWNPGSDKKMIYDNLKVETFND